MLWIALAAGAVALLWWWRAYAQARCRDCGGRAVFCALPYVCAARRQRVVEPERHDEAAELPPPEELL